MESCTRFAISSCLSNFPLFFFSTIFIIIFIFSNKEKVSWSRRVTSRIAPINQPHHLFCFVKKNHDSKVHRDLEKTFANVDFGEGVPNRPSDIHDYSVFGIFWKCARIGERLSPYVSLCCVAMAVRGFFFSYRFGFHVLLVTSCIFLSSFSPDLPTQIPHSLLCKAKHQKACSQYC